MVPFAAETCDDQWMRTGTFTIDGRPLGEVREWVVDPAAFRDALPKWRPTYGPEMPTSVDRAEWVLATADLTDTQRDAIQALLDDYLHYG